MPYLRLTILRPLPGMEERARDLLKQIDHLFADEPGLIMSFDFGEGGASKTPLGRVSVWETDAAANKLARSDRSLALRAELQRLCREDIVDNLTEITHAHWTAATQRLPHQDS